MFLNFLKYQSDLSIRWAPRVEWQVALKRIIVELELLTDIDMLLMLEKRGRGIYHSIYIYAKANNKCMKKIKNYHILNIGM